jgi:hypothetical protein
MANQMIQITKLPASAEEFEEMRNQMATTPEGAAALFVAAMIGKHINHIYLRFKQIA